MGLLTDALQTIRGHKIFANDVTVKGKLRLEGEITRTRTAGFKLDMNADVDVGTLKLIPVGGTTRTILNGVSGPADAWTAADCSAVVPTGTEAILASTLILSGAAAAGKVHVIFSYADNNTSGVPTLATHPESRLLYVAAGATTVQGGASKDVVIPLNSSRVFYYYRLIATNADSVEFYVAVMGYYL